MIGFELGNEGLTDLPEADQIAAQKAANRQTLINLNSRLSMPITSLKPDPRLTEITGGPDALNSIPGVGLLEWPAGMAASVADALGTVRNAITGRNDDWHVPGLPTMRKMGDNFEQTRQEVMQKVAEHTPLVAPDPNNQMDDLNDQLASLSGVGIPIAPAVVAKGIEKLPVVARQLGRIVVPTTKDALGHAAKAEVVAPVLTGVNEAGATLDAASDDKATAAANAATTGAPPIPPPADATTMPAPGIQVAAGTPKTKTDVGQQIIDLSAPQTQARQSLPSDIIDLSGGSNAPIDLSAPNGGAAVPMQQGLGVGTHGIWGALATLAGAGAMVRAGRAARERNAGVTETARAARMNDPVYAAAATDFNNKQLALQGGNGPMSSGVNDKAPEAPLPWTNQLRTSLNADNTSVMDKTARAQEIIRTLGTPSTAEALAKEYGNVHNPGASRVAFDAFLDTGYHPEAKVQIPAPNTVDKNISRLDDVQQGNLAEGLFSANEQDNRKNNRAEFAKNNPGQIPTPDDIRHDLKYHDDATLQTAVDKMMNDPATASIAQDMWDQSKGMREIYANMGIMPRSELANLNAAHPHHLPETGLTGKTMAPLSQRDRTLFTGVDQVNSKPWMAQAQMLEDMHREAELRRHRRDLYDSMSEAQTRYPDAAKVFTDVQAPTNKPVYYGGGETRSPIVAIHSSTGTKYVHIANSDVLNMFTGDSLKRAHVAMEMSTIPRRIYQNFTTGIGSLATGSFAAGKNLLYTIPAMSINTPKGMYSGLIHKGVTTATGGRWNSGVARGLDMFSNLGYIPYSYARGVGERRLRNIANVLDPKATNSVNKWLRASYGDAVVDKFQAAAQQYYRDSASYDAVSSGMGGGGLGPKSELQPLNLRSDMRASIAAAHAVPQLYHSGQWVAGSKPFVLNLHNALLEALGNISEAGHMASFRLNRDNPNVSRPGLIAETRALTGDPSVSGANTLLRRYTERVPFTNITLQGTGRAVRGVAEKPLNAAMTMATGFGTLHLISLLSAMQSPQTLKNYEDELSTQEHASGVPIYFPNGSQIRIPIAQEYQPASTFVKSLVANLANVVAMQHDPLTFHSVQNMILDFLGSHISTQHMNEMKYGAANTISPFLGWPLLGQLDPYKLIQGEGFANSFHTPLNSGPGSGVRTMPNQVPDGMLEGKEGQMATKGLAAIFGLAGSAFAEHAGNFEHYLKQYGNWSDAIGQVGHDWMQRAGDRNPMFPSAMEHPMRLSLMPPIVEQTQRDLQWMKGIGGSRTEPIAEGTTGRGRNSLPVYDNGDSKIPKDPTMRWLWGVIEGANKRIAPQENKIAAIRKQMTSVATHGMDVEQRRTWMNARTRDLADAHRPIQDIIQDTNYTMSKALNRNIHVGMNIDWQKGPEQFMDAQ